MKRKKPAKIIDVVNVGILWVEQCFFQIHPSFARKRVCFFLEKRHLSLNHDFLEEYT